MKRYLDIAYMDDRDLGCAAFLAHQIPQIQEPNLLVNENVEDSKESSAPQQTAQKNEPHLVFDENSNNFKDLSFTYDIDSVCFSSRILPLKPGIIIQLYSFPEINSALKSNNFQTWNFNGADVPLFRIPNVQIGICGLVYRASFNLVNYI